jgi:hypothetical protein
MGKPTKAFLNQVHNTIAMLSAIGETMPMSEVLPDPDGNMARFDADGNLQVLTVEQAAESVRQMKSCSVGTMIRNLTRLHDKLSQGQKAQKEPKAPDPEKNRAPSKKKKASKKAIRKAK